MRKHLVVSVVLFVSVVSVPGGDVLGGVARAANDCLSAPNAPSPQGSHWYYRIDRVDKRKCWYLGAEGTRVRSDVSQGAAPLRITPARPQPTEAAPAKPQSSEAQPVKQPPTLDEIFKRLDARAPVATTTANDAPAGEAPSAGDSERSDPPVASTPEPVVTGTATLDAPAKTESPPKAEAQEQMPSVWPVLAASPPEAAKQPPSGTRNREYMLLLLASVLLLVGYCGRIIVNRVAAHRFARRRARARPHALRPAYPSRDAMSPAIGHGIDPATRAGVRRARPTPADPAEIDDALRWLARAAGATRREHQARREWETAASR